MLPMPHRPHSASLRGERRAEEGAPLRELDRTREPLFHELSKLLEDPDYHRGQPPHLCCRRERNQMRISPLEARAILSAFRRNAALRAKLPEVLARLQTELPKLKETTARQNFDCPLLEGTRCLVHAVAKPMGCTAWNPGRDFSKAGWRAFAERDQLNDRVYGRNWKLRAIPLWLKRMFQRELRRSRALATKTPRGSTPPDTLPRGK